MTCPDGVAAAWRGAVSAGLARLALALGAAACIVPLLSAANPERLPAAVPAALAGLLALALCRPALGLAVAAAAAPLAAWTVRTADLHPLRLAEALVLAALAGTLLRLAFAGRTDARAAAWPAGVGPAAVALAAVAGASAAVELGLLQAGIPLTWPAAAGAAGRVATDYLYGSTAIVPGLLEAARLIEGAALVLVILAWRRRRPALPRQLALATLAGAAAAAAVNFGALAAETLAAERPGALLLSYLGGRRLAVHVADFNATGSYFLMAALVGLGLTLREPAARATGWYGLATLAAGAACWLAGSRTALAVALLAAFAAAAWRLPACSAGGRRRRRALAGLAVAALVTVPLAMLAAFPERARHARSSGVDAAWEMAARTVRYRVGIADAGLRAWSTAPLLGVGAGRYYDLSEQFTEGELPARFRRENAHNNFLQVAAELGAAGLAAFLGLLAAAGYRVWQAARSAAAREPLLVGAGAGAAAFLVTCLAGHPLLVAETAYPFWIVFGLLLALAHGRLPAARAPARRRPILTPAIVLILAATVPVRIAAAARGMTFDGTPAAVDALRSGLFDWELEHATGRRFRWTGAHATTFVPGAAQAVRIVLRALHTGPDGGPVVVDVALGGRPVRRVPLFDRRWVEVTLHPVPGRPAAALQRIDLRVTPPWTARERRNGDGRTLGVQIRELAVMRAPAAQAG